MIHPVPQDKELLRLYLIRKDLQWQLLRTHETMQGLGDLPCVKRLDLSPEAIVRRAALWPVLDELNVRIRRWRDRA